MPNRMFKWFIVITIIFIIIFIVLPEFLKPEVKEIGYSEFQSQVKSSNVDSPLSIEILEKGKTITGKLKDGKTRFFVYTDRDDIYEFLDKYELRYGEKVKSSFNIWSFLIPIGLVVLGLIILNSIRSHGPGGALDFAKSKAKLFVGSKVSTTFEDVAGVEEAKEELQEMVVFLRDPGRFTALGARIPRGVLLVGPAGTGKTLMAKAVAGEAGVAFFSLSASEFVEMFVGVGASRVRDLFDQAKRNAPCIIFIDEIDAVGRHRGNGLGNSHDEREQTLNQILVEMDGFNRETNVIVIAATNRPDILDQALLRPGRFDRQVVLDRPDVRGREAILRVHAKGKPFNKNVDLRTIAKETPGFTGADLENVINEAAILAARRSKNAIGMPELDEAVDRVIAGPERKSRKISEKERKIIAFHEAGHALVAHGLPGVEKVYKISCIPRGMAAGYTKILPEEDRILKSKDQLKADMACLMGGREAEKLLKISVTTGASNDLERATAIARRMVTEFGMSDKLGPRTFGKKDSLIFLGKEISEERNYSEKTAEIIDQEIDVLLKEARLAASQILIKKEEKLAEIADRLLKEETLDGDALQKLLN